MVYYSYKALIAKKKHKLHKVLNIGWVTHCVNYSIVSACMAFCSNFWFNIKIKEIAHEIRLRKNIFNLKFNNTKICTCSYICIVFCVIIRQITTAISFHPIVGKIAANRAGWKSFIMLTCQWCKNLCSF